MRSEIKIVHTTQIYCIIAISLIQFLSEGWIRPSASVESFLRQAAGLRIGP